MQFPEQTVMGLHCDGLTDDRQLKPMTIGHKQKKEPKKLRYVHAAVDIPRYPQTREAARRLRQRAKHELPTPANTV
jgi:hypothetical protein